MIQKLPLFIHGTPVAVHFACVVTDPHAGAVEAFVKEHVALLSHLALWTLHVVVARGVATEAACVGAYQRALACAELASVGTADLEWFRTTRALVLRGELRGLAVGDLRRYRELSVRVERRLQEGRCAGLPVVHLLPYTYTQFGSLPGCV